MTIRIEINTENAAFDPDPAYELANILGRLAESLLALGSCTATAWDGYPLFDHNGNRVGTVQVRTGTGT